MRPAKRSRIQKAADAAAACAISLQNGDRLRIEHRAKIPRRVAVFTGGDIHAQRSALAHLVQSDEMIGAYRLFKPADALLRKSVRKLDRLRDCVRAVCIDKKIARLADGLARGLDAGWVLVGMVPIFILTLANPFDAQPPS